MTEFLVLLVPFAVLVLVWILLVGRLQSWLQGRQTGDSSVEQFEQQAENPEPGDGWSRSGAIHTYRDSDALQHTASLSHLVVSGLTLSVLLVPIGVAIVATSSEVEGAVAVVLFFGIAYFGNRRYRGRVCGEIRLADDGTCELETKRQVIRLHVNEIEAVKYEHDPDRSAAYYISYPGGSVQVDSAMTGFADFLCRLKTLNTAVDLTSFPAKTWPDLHQPATSGRRTDVSRFIRRALFPLFVIALLVYLASQTLVGK